MRGGAVVAALLMALAAGCAIWVRMEAHETPDPSRISPLLTAVAVGLYAGWTRLGPVVGGGYVRSALFGLGAAVVALVIFAVFVAIARATEYQFTTQFKSVREALFQTLDFAIGVLGEAAAEPRPAYVLAGGALTAGVFAEAFARIWR